MKSGRKNGSSKQWKRRYKDPQRSIYGNCENPKDIYHRLSRPEIKLTHYRSNAYRDKGGYDRAIEDYNQAIKLKPNFAAAYADRGMAYHGQEKSAFAIQDLEKAVSLDPDYQWTKYRLKEIMGY